MIPDSYHRKKLVKGKIPRVDWKSGDVRGQKDIYSKIKLEPKTNYCILINSDEFSNFKDSAGTSAVPFLLEFETK